jgi:hypothetical protein
MKGSAITLVAQKYAPKVLLQVEWEQLLEVVQGQGVGVAGVGAANNNSNNAIAEKPNIPSVSTTPRSTTIRIQGSTGATFFSAISKSISNSTSISGRKIYPKKLVIENVPEELNELDERPITPGPPSAPPPDENNLRNVIINRDHNLFLDHMEV